MSSKIKFVVIDENNFGYVDHRQPDHAGILNSSVVRGATHTWHDGPFYLPLARVVRPATLADFEVYRINIEPYKNDKLQAYELPTQ